MWKDSSASNRNNKIDDILSQEFTKMTFIGQITSPKNADNSTSKSCEMILKELMASSEEFISELKRCNMKLMDFLGDNIDPLQILIHYITVPWEDTCDYERAFKLPSIAADLFAAAPIFLYGAFFKPIKIENRVIKVFSNNKQDKGAEKNNKELQQTQKKEFTLLDLLFEFLNDTKENEVNEVLAGYWASLINALIANKPQETIGYILSNEGSIDSLFNHIDNQSIAGVLSGFLLLENDKFTPQPGHLKLFLETKLRVISTFISKFDNYSSDELQLIALIFVDLVGKYYQVQDGKEMLECLCNQQSVTQLFGYLTGSKESSQRGAAIVIQALAQYYAFNANSFISGYPEGSEYYNIMLAEYDAMPFIQCFIKNAPIIAKMLLPDGAGAAGSQTPTSTRSASVVMSSNGVFGWLRLKILEIIGQAIRILFPSIQKAICSSGILNNAFSVLFNYEWHNIAHQQLIAILLFILDNSDKPRTCDYAAHLMTEIKITEQIIKYTANGMFYFDQNNKNDKFTTKGNLGFIIIIAEGIERVFTREISINSKILEYRNTEWQNFRENVLEDHKEYGCQDLGGFDDFLNGVDGSANNDIINQTAEANGESMSIYNEYERQQLADKYRQRQDYQETINLRNQYKQRRENKNKGDNSVGQRSSPEKGISVGNSGIEQQKTNNSMTTPTTPIPPPSNPMTSSLTSYQYEKDTFTSTITKNNQYYSENPIIIQIMKNYQQEKLEEEQANAALQEEDDEEDDEIDEGIQDGSLKCIPYGNVDRNKDSNNNMGNAQPTIKIASSDDNNLTKKNINELLSFIPREEGRGTLSLSQDSFLSLAAPPVISTFSKDSRRNNFQNENNNAGGSERQIEKASLSADSKKQGNQIAVDQTQNTGNNSSNSYSKLPSGFQVVKPSNNESMENGQKKEQEKNIVTVTGVDKGEQQVSPNRNQALQGKGKEKDATVITQAGETQTPGEQPQQIPGSQGSIPSGQPAAISTKKESNVELADHVIKAEKADYKTVVFAEEETNNFEPINIEIEPEKDEDSGIIQDASAKSTSQGQKTPDDKLKGTTLDAKKEQENNKVNKDTQNFKGALKDESISPVGVDSTAPKAQDLAIKVFSPEKKNQVSEANTISPVPPRKEDLSIPTSKSPVSSSSPSQGNSNPSSSSQLQNVNQPVSVNDPSVLPKISLSPMSANSNKNAISPNNLQQPSPSSNYSNNTFSPANVQPLIQLQQPSPSSKPQIETQPFSLSPSQQIVQPSPSSQSNSKNLIENTTPSSGTAELSGAGVNSFTQQVRQQQSSGSSSSLPVESSLTPPISPLNSLSQPNSNKNSLVGPDPAEQIQKAVQSSTQAPTSAPSPSTITQQTPEIPKSEANPSQPPKPLLIDLSKATETASAQQTSEQQQPPQKHSPFKLPETSASVWQFPSSTFVPAYIPSSKSTHEKPNQYSENQTVEEYQAYKPTMFAMTPNNKSNPTFGENDNNFQNLAKAVEIDHRKASLRYSYDPYSLNLLKEKQAAEASAANPHGASHDKTVDDSSSSSAPGSEMKSAAERFGIKSLMKSPQEEQSLNKFVLKETIVKQSAFARKLRYGEDNEEENDDEVQVGPQRSSMPAKLMKEGSKDENKVNLSEYAKLSKSSPLSFKNKFSENLHSSQEVQNNQQGVGAQKQGISSFGISEETTSKQASTGAPVESAQSSDSLKLQEKSNSNPSPTSSISAYAPQPAAKSLDEKSLVEKYSNPSGYPASSSQLNEQMIRSPQFGPQSSTLPLSNAAQSPSLQYSSNNSYKPIVSPAQSASSSSALNAPPSVVAPAISKEEKYSYSEKEATLLKSKLDSSKDYNELLNHIRDFQNVFGILNQNNIELIEERILTSVELRQNFLEVAEKNGCQLETTLTSLEQDKQRQEQELKLQYQTEFEMIERQTKLESDEAKAKKKFTEFIGKLIGDRVNQLYDINFKYSMLQKQSLEKSIIEAKILNDRLRSMNFVVPNITTSQIVREQTAATTMFQQQQEQTRGAANNNNTLSTSTGLKQQQGSSLQNRSQQQQLTPASPVLTVSASRKHKGSDAFDDEYEHASPCFGSNDLGIPLTQEQNWDQSKDTAQGKSAGDSSPSFGNAMINSYKIQQSPSRSSRHNSYSQRSMHSSQRKNSTSTTEEGAGTTNNPATDDPYDFKASSSARDKSPMPNQTPAFMGSSNSAMFNMTSSTNSSGSGSSSDYVRRLTSNTTLPMQRQHQASPPRRATLPSNTMMTKAAGGNEQQQIQQSLGHYQYGQQHHNANINTSQPLPAHGYPAQQKQPHSVPQQPQVQPMRSAETLQQLPVQVPVTQQQQQHRKIFAQNPPPNMPAIVSKQQQQNPAQQQQLGTPAAVVYPGQPQQPLSNLAEEQYKKLQDDQYKQLSDNLKIPSFQSSNPPPPSSQSSSYTSAQFQQQQQQSLLQLQQQQLLIAKQQQQQLLAQQQQQLQPQQQPPQLQQPYQYTKPPGIPSQQYPPNATALPIQQNTQLPPPPANYSAVSSRYPSKPSLISSQQPTLQQPQQQQQQGGSVRTIQIDLSKEEQQAQALGMPTLKNTASAINLTNPASKPPLQSQYNSVGGDYESNNNINVRSHQQQQYLGLPQQERTKPLSNSTYFDDQLQFRGMNHHNNRPLSTSDIMGQQQPQLQPKDQSYQPESSFAKPSYPPMMAPQTQQGYLPSNVSTNTLSAQQLNASNPASSQILNQDVQDIIKKYTSGRSTEQIIKQTSEQVQLLTNNASSNNLAAKSGSNPAYGYNSLPGITQQQQWSSTAQQYTGDSSTGYGNASGGIGTTLGAGNYKNVSTAYSQYSSGSYFTPSIPETSSQDYYNYQQQNYEDRSSSSSGNNNNNSSTSLNSSTSSQLQQLPLDTSTSSMQSQQGKKIKIVMKKQSNSHSSNNNSSSDASEYLKNAAQQQQQQSQQMISARVQPQQYLQYTPSELQQQQTTQLIFSTAGEADLNYSQQQQHMNMKKARQIDQKDKDFLSMIGKNPKMN